MAALWPERCTALVAVSGYLIGSIEINQRPLPPKAELGWWYLFYFSTERGRLGYRRYTREFNKLIWQLASPTWDFDEATFDRTAAAFDNPDHVDIVIHNYRWRLGLAEGEVRYLEFEQMLAERPTIDGADDHDRQRLRRPERRRHGLRRPVHRPLRTPDPRRHRAQRAPGGSDRVRPSRHRTRTSRSRPTQESTMTEQPNVVLIHGAFADGSSWSAVVEDLQAKGYHVTAPQFPLTSLADDVARLRQALAWQSGPTIVVGHSYGGQVMTALGDDTANVVGLVYIAAFGLDEGESINAVGGDAPSPPALANLIVDERGFGRLPEDDFVGHFAADVDPVRARVMHAAQQPVAMSVFGDVMGTPAWRSLPVVVPGGRRRRGDRAGRRADVRPADGRRDGRGRLQPRRDGLAPGRRGGTDRSRGRGPRRGTGRRGAPA